MILEQPGSCGEGTALGGSGSEEGVCCRLVVKCSAIHGQGCYAGEPIAAGALVAEYLGEVICAEEAYRREQDPARPGIYTFWTGETQAIDGLFGGNASRFINHCCTPTCDYRIEDGRVFIHAARDLAAGEELTIDYSYAAEGERVPCRCGVPACRGRINAIPD